MLGVKSRPDRIRLLVATVCLSCLAFGFADQAEARIAKPVRGKKYKLTKQHGPWMIMVASFSEPPPERRAEGMTPAEAAAELVFELRQNGVPAYAFSQQDIVEHVATTDRLGRERMRQYVAQQGSVCVLAGNYGSASERKAQGTLAWIKQFHPKFLQDVKADNGFVKKLQNGGLYRLTPGRPGPMSGALLTINPLLSPEEVQRRERDPLLVKLNSGGQYSLAQNPHKYTVVVASFYGKSLTQVDDGNFDTKASQFAVSGSLDQAAENARMVAGLLRNGNFNITNPQAQGKTFEAFVYHDRFRSIVTIGGFDSPQDPRIPQIMTLFGAKVKQNKSTGQNVMTAEMLALPGNKPGTLPTQRWLFDPRPRVMEVPQL